MKVEILIYSYLAVCAAMIGFNIVCIFVFRHKDKKLDTHSIDFTEEVRKHLSLSEIPPSHRKFLSKKLRKINNLMAFDKTLETLYSEDSEKLSAYIEKLFPVFFYLTLEYNKKNKIQAAYFPYIIKKYRLFKGRSISLITDSMLSLVRDSALYCRENALQALYAIGDVDSVVTALSYLDDGRNYHHSKLITDGLLSFDGDKAALSDALWAKLPLYSEKMQVAVLDFFRFSSGSHCERILSCMLSEDYTDEVRYSCIRYFAKYPYEPARQHLLDFSKMNTERYWEYAAIAATALASYPGEETVSQLKSLLYSKNWFVRFNASQSLETLGLDYGDLVDVFESNDRYASEIMRYRFDRKSMIEEEAAAAK